MSTLTNEKERCLFVPELIRTNKPSTSSKLCRYCCQLCFIPCFCATVFLFIVVLVVYHTDILNIVNLRQGNISEEKLQVAEPIPASSMLVENRTLTDMAATAGTSAQLFLDTQKADNGKLHWTYKVSGASKSFDLEYQYYKEFGCLKTSTPGYYLVMFKVTFKISEEISNKESYVNMQIKEENQTKRIVVPDRFDFPSYSGKLIYFPRINFGYFQLNVGDMVCITMPPEHIPLIFQQMRATTFNLHRFSS